MTRKSFGTLRIYKEDTTKFKALLSEVSNAQREPVRAPEVLRRILRIPNLKDVLKKDAEIFKRGNKSIW